MINITGTVREIVENDPLLYEVIASGFANFSAIARKIKPAIEEKAFKKAELPSIIIALSRIATEFKKEDNIYSMIKANIRDYRVRYPISQLVFDKAEPTFNTLLKLEAVQEEFVSLTSGETEINVVVNREQGVKIADEITPKKMLQNLALVSIRFDEKLVYTPGLLHYIMTILFAKNINVVDVVSTYTELNILVQGEDVNRVMSLAITPQSQVERNKVALK